MLLQAASFQNSDIDFYHLAENIKKNYWIQDTGLNSLKTASIKVVRKAGEFIGNKIADAVTKSNDDIIKKEESVEEIIIPPEKKDKILNNSETGFYPV